VPPHLLATAGLSSVRIARNLIDEGQFGSALIFSPFNYAYGNHIQRYDRLCRHALRERRQGFADTDELPGYYPLNLGFTHIFHLPEKYGEIQFRFDVTNVFDQSYQLRSGTGIGVFAPQFGPRRGFFGGVTWRF
jgi:outer membrane receptor protein involved in Fe transport